jgi:FlaG/FlaF family flagellin (archaellin)
LSKIFKKKPGMLRDENAVSPMIATIMLIAIVAVLGAVIAASSMKSAGNIDTTNLAVTLKASETGAGIYNITLTHAGGDKLTTNLITYSVTSGENSAPMFLPVSNNFGGNITTPSTDPGTFKAGEEWIIGKVTVNNTNINATGGPYHVVIRYDNKKVLYDDNVEIS